jgi:hypothetical protein
MPPLSRKLQMVRHLSLKVRQNKCLIILHTHVNGQIHKAFSPLGRIQNCLLSHFLNWQKSHSDDTNSVFAKQSAGDVHFTHSLQSW